MRPQTPRLSRPARSTAFGLVLMATASTWLSVRHGDDALATADSPAAMQHAYPDQLLGELGLCGGGPDTQLSSDPVRQALETSLARIRSQYQAEFHRQLAEIRQLRAKAREMSPPAGPEDLEWESRAAAERRLASAESAHGCWLREIRREVLAGLPDDVREQVQRALANRVLPEAYRGYALSSAQQSALQLTRMRYYERLALASSDAARNGLKTEYANRIELILKDESLGESLGENLGESLGENLGESLGENLGDNVKENVAENVEKSMGENAKNVDEQKAKESVDEDVRRTPGSAPRTTPWSAPRTTPRSTPRSTPRLVKATFW